MKKNYYIFVLTFLCLLCGEMGYAQVYRGENNNSGNSGNSVCTSEQTELVESFECYDIYFTQIDEYYCATAAHISTYWYDTYVLKDCGGTGTIDCNGVQNGTAYESNCGCIGGNTGIDECPEEVDCNGDLNGTAYLASCGCIGGNTGIDECPEEEPTDDTPPGTCQLICLGDYLVLNKELCQCEKLPRPWYYDGDGDEWHDSLFGIPTQKDSPGTGWRNTTKGEDCNDSNILITNNCYKDYFIDNDGDGYDAGIISAKEQGLYKTTTKGTDCDDNNTNIHKLNKCGKCEVEPVSGSCGGDCSKKISKTVLLELSNKLNLSIQQLLTVYNVETEGNAFRGNGEPKVLFERHYFSTLTNGKYDNSHPSLSNPTEGGYGLYSEQLQKLRAAYALDPSAAIQSASYGGFQIMGANYKAAGYSNLEDFYKDMTSANVDLHLKAFANYISSKNLIDEIQNNRWTEFASKYNGPKYKKNNYDGKMAEEYAKLISDKDLSKKDCF